MAYVRIVQWGTYDERVYGAVVRALDLEHDHPLGLMFHAAGEVDGHCQVLTVWHSKEYAEQFDRDRMQPTMAKLGWGTSRAPVTEFEAPHLVTP